jgi:hypothetical protein
MKHCLLLSYLLLDVLLFSCKKESPANNNDNESFDYPTGFLEYADIPLHSYFIYRDSANGNEDSVVVTENKKQTNFSFGNGVIPGNKDKYYSLELNCTLTKITVTNGSSLWLKTRSVTGVTPETIPVATPVLLFAGECSDCLSSIMEYPITTYYDPAADRGVDILDNYEVEGKGYVDVIHIVFAFGSPADNDYKKVTYYWAKNVGIVKRTLITKSSTHTWTLVKNG